MAFRFWAFRRFVFLDEHARNPDKALESTLTAGGIAEAFEDHHEHQGQAGQVGQSAQHSGPSGTATPLRRSRRSAQLGDSFGTQGVEDFVIQQ